MHASIHINAYQYQCSLSILTSLTCIYQIQVHFSVCGLLLEISYCQADISCRYISKVNNQRHFSVYTRVLQFLGRIQISCLIFKPSSINLYLRLDVSWNSLEFQAGRNLKRKEKCIPITEVSLCSQTRPFNSSPWMRQEWEHSLTLEKSLLFRLLHLDRLS